jgi:hypothetical protein
MHPFAVAGESGRYFHTKLDVMCGKHTNFPLLIALQRVSKVVENKHWCINLTVSSINVDWWIPLCKVGVFSLTDAIMVFDVIG